MTNLISGKEAKLAWAKGENVQARPKTPSETWEDLSGRHSLDIFEQVISYEFRLKPRTITLNGIEVPAPFEPNHGDEIWFLNPDYGCGYADGDYDPAESVIQFGVWRTEDEVKQVVAALRQIFGGV